MASSSDVAVKRVITTAASPATGERRRSDRFIIVTASSAVLLLAALIGVETAPFLVALFGVGVILGIALYHGAFGFTGGWRSMVSSGRSAGVRAQLALLALASMLFIPVLAYAPADVGLVGTLAPVGVSLVVGAFLFGFGMQLGGGCGSGTLFTVGAGNIRMVLTLVFFIVGSVVGTLHLPWWLELPGVNPISLIDTLGVGGALAGQLVACAGLAWWFARLEHRRHGRVEPAVFTGPRRGVLPRLVQGPWPLYWAVLVLALGNLAVLLLSGHPWGITFAFGLWGAKALQALGVDMGQHAFWTWDYPALALADSVLVNVTSVTNFGLLLGAMLAAGLAGRFNQASAGRIPPRSLLAAVLGGLIMGYGARLGFGCNIGALFSGIASASVHGWVWFAAAWAGSWLGIQARPRLSLSRD
jgi:uncharacterized protein